MPVAAHGRRVVSNGEMVRHGAVLSRRLSSVGEVNWAFRFIRDPARVFKVIWIGIDGYPQQARPASRGVYSQKGEVIRNSCGHDGDILFSPEGFAAP